MLSHRCILPAALACSMMVSPIVMADSLYPHDGHHVLGVGIGGGLVEYDFQEKTPDSGSTALDLFYRWLPSQHWGIEAGWRHQSPGIVGIFSSLLGDEYKHDLRQYRASVIALGQVSDRNFFYGKLGASYFDLEAGREEMKVYDDGTAGLLAVGWEYRFYWGLGMHIEYEYSKGSDFKNSQLLYGLSFRF